MVLFVLPCLALPATAALAGGVGDGALRVAVTVNGRGQTGLRPPALRAGGPVVKRYRLVNRGEAHLYGVKVVDPQVPSGSVRCPAGPLAALGELECVARFRAAPGAHRGTVRAEAAVPSLGRRLTATARTGYTGVAGILTLTERVTFGAPGRGGAGAPGRAAPGAPGRGAATLTYTVTNRGNRALHAVRVEDTALGLRAGAVDCAGRPGTVPLLAPGASARCTATVRRAPGTHRSTGLASGSDRVTTYGTGGGRVRAPTLVARSSAVFTVAPPAVPVGGSASPGASVRNPAREPVRGSSGAAGEGGLGVGPGIGTGVGGAGAAGAVGAAEAVGAAGAAAGAAALPEGVAGVGAGAAPPPAAAPPAAAAAPGVTPQGPPLDPPGGEAGAGVGVGVGPGAGVEAGVGVGGVDGLVTPPFPPSPPPPPSARRAAALDSEGFLGRVRRRGREASELGVATTLLLLLIPAAVAAALLGNRRS
ncbi:hypothetical protein AB0A76_12615 [Streptomyces exfoliatus]|uniref:DUF7507 domain-containing protein n=1 Tax=Streptomyces exfoliatus TaxID=1905 RepID=A0ABV3CUZ3_STREX